MIKELTFLTLYEIPLHLSMLFSGMAHGAFWKYIKVQQTGQKKPFRHSGRKEQFWRGHAGLVMNRNDKEFHRNHPRWQVCCFNELNVNNAKNSFQLWHASHGSAGSARRGFPLADRGKLHLQSTNVPRIALAVTICCTDFGRKSLDESWLSPPRRLLPWRLRSIKRSLQVS